MTSNNRNYLFTLLESVSLKIRCQEGHVPCGTLGRVLPCLLLVAGNPCLYPHCYLCLYTALSLQVYSCSMPVQFLVGELRSHILHDKATKKEKKYFSVFLNYSIMTKLLLCFYSEQCYLNKLVWKRFMENSYISISYCTEPSIK